MFLLRCTLRLTPWVQCLLQDSGIGRCACNLKNSQAVFVLHREGKITQRPGPKKTINQADETCKKQYGPNDTTPNATTTNTTKSHNIATHSCTGASCLPLRPHLRRVVTLCV